MSDAYRRRVFGTLGTTAALMNVRGTLLAGLLGNRVAVLNVQAVGSMTAGLAALIALRRLARRSIRNTTPAI